MLLGMRQLVLGYPQTMKARWPALPQAALPAGYHDYIWSLYPARMLHPWSPFGAHGKANALTGVPGGAMFRRPPSRGESARIRAAAAPRLVCVAIVSLPLVPLLSPVVAPDLQSH